MTGIRRIDDERAAAALAGLLNGNARRRPVVVVTIPASRTEPWIDVDEIVREAGDLADVYLMPTSDASWEFSRRMADGTQVYGGAGRVYPVGHAWASDLAASPLRFAWSEADGQRATELLISDMFRMAAAAGLLRVTPNRSGRACDGTVTMLIAGRGLVGIGNSMPATVAEELTAKDVPIERILTVGQRVSGWYDPDTNRLDLRRALRTPNAALSAYTVGDVVLAAVATVAKDTAELMLYPETNAPAVIARAGIAEVTSNPFDDLRTLMTAGEVVRARITCTGPRWALALDDVDDNEPVIEAPSLLTGGPSWLVETPLTTEPAEQEHPGPGASGMPVRDASPAVLSPDQGTVAPGQPGSDRSGSGFSVPAPATPEPARPSPALFDRKRPHPDTPPLASGAIPSAPIPAAAPPASVPAPASEGTKGLLLKIDGLNAEVSRLTRENERLTREERASTDERRQLHDLLVQAEQRANRAEEELTRARSRLRKAKSARNAARPAEIPSFADPEQGFRYLVLTQWAKRTMPGEQASRPLPDYVIGPGFLDSLAKLEGISEEKVADVVFEVLTGIAAQNSSRRVHQLRSGLGGDDPQRVRPDGARAWRVSLQVNTPSARRLHYWLLPDGQVELARVATHDDYDA
ncbi:MAG: hypothetical protein QM708_10210 [Propioniciclava sp.]|uniref:hypothetical protein n=1 Tax=Propioniciclava sp. TaxID=2038686 RepID=UPI0039E302F4